MFTKEIEKSRSHWLLVIFAMIGLGLFFLTGCGSGSHHDYIPPAAAEIDPCEATPVDLVVGFGDYDYAVYLDCVEDEVELWLHEEGEIELRTSFEGWCNELRAWGEVIDSRSFELTYIESGFWVLDDWWWSCDEYEGYVLVTLCNDLMTISGFEFPDLYLVCETATFWELRFENGVGDLESIDGPIGPGVLFAPIENPTTE